MAAAVLAVGHGMVAGSQRRAVSFEAVVAGFLLALAVGWIMLGSRGAAAAPAGVWRDVFESSPASYTPFDPQTLQKLVTQLHVSATGLKQMLPAAPVSGTVRFRITVTGGGTQLRVRLTNEEGAGFLGISAASIGLATGSGFSARVGSLKALTFGGVRAIDIPPGAPVVSDPVALAVVPGSELDVSILPSHAIQLEPRGGSAVAVGAGDQTLTSELQGMRQMSARPIVTGIAVMAPARTKVVAALGDSITDGNRLVPGQLHGWPEELARRLTKRASNTYTVVNAGIGGNRVLQPGWGPAALARLDRDVLRIDGLSHLIVLEGINDIGMAGNTLFGVSPAVTADELIAAYRQIIARAHARNVKVGFATLTPFDGSFYASDEKERIRATVNRWIRASGEPDFVIDFDTIMADPKAPRRLRKDYDSGDHLHPSDVGYRAMGDAIDLSVFR